MFDTDADSVGSMESPISGVFPDEDNKAQQGLSWMLRLSSHCFTLCCVNAFTVEKRVVLNPPESSVRVKHVLVSLHSVDGFGMNGAKKCPNLCQCFFKQTNWWKGWMLNCFQLVSWKNVWVISSVVKTLSVFARALKCFFNLMRFGDAWLHFPAGKLTKTRKNLIGVGMNSFQDKINKVVF